ncbi:MAG: hypothetical protein SWH78_13115 [Thermodesulfobacteriota bacterium]|nr:hypothetical protein [Thermodesulfobacteriota bacterium]
MKYLKRRGPDAKERKQMEGIIGMVVSSKKWRLLLVAMWIGTAFFFSSPNLLAADVWHKVFDESYTETSGHSHIHAMAEFQGTLYVVAGRASQQYPHPGRVYRIVSAGCWIWDDVTPPQWPDDDFVGKNDMAMLVHDNRLYVGNSIGDVFCTDDGTTWFDVTANLPEIGANSIDFTDMAEFKGQLYIVRQDRVWWLNTNSEQLQWEQTPYNPPGRGTIESLEAFNGGLYAGIGFDAPNGVELVKTDDGQNWTQVVYSHPGSSLVGHAYALKPFKGYLYLGLYEDNVFWRTDGSETGGEAISEAFSGASGGPFRLLEHADRFYLGTFNKAMEHHGAPLLYSSTNGTQWSDVPGCPIESDETISITAMESYGGDLYVATTGTNPDDGEIAIYRFGAAPTCRLAEVNTSVVALKERVQGIAAAISGCHDIPCLDVDPPIGPIPPTWTGWEFPLIGDIVDALIAVEVPAGAEETIELAADELKAVNGKVRMAMEIVFLPLGPSGVSDIAFQLATDTFEDDLAEAIGYLDDALVLCDSVSALLSSIATTVTIDGCYTGVPDQVYSGQYISERISQCEEGAENHGQFVQCVARLSNDLLADEIITSEKKESLVECAAESDIAKEN